MPTRYNNMLTIRLTEEQIDFLLNLMTENFCIDSMASAVRYCINSEIHYSKTTKEHISEEKNRKLNTIQN